jgi:hypothetical protein
MNKKNPIFDPASSLDPVMEILLAEDRVMPKKTPLEESWNGLFCTCSNTSMDESENWKEPTSNKKTGHTSFTDLGVFDAKANQQHALQRVAEEETTKAKFMRLRLQKMIKSKKQSKTNSQNYMERLHSSDSELLRKDSSMDTSELDGAWYRAKHPRHCPGLERMAHSSPAGTFLDFSM